MSQALSEESRKQLDRLECTTVLGQVIDSDVESEKYQNDYDYPLRFQLRELSRYIWYELLKEGKQERDVMRGVHVVKGKFGAFLLPSEGRLEMRVQHQLSGDLLDRHRDSRRNMRRVLENDEEAEIPPLRDWCLATDPTNALELLEDDWLQQKDLWQVEQDWTWAHVYDFLALLTIDAALSYAEAGEPYKAAVAAARAAEYHGTATAIRWSEATESAAISTLGKRGSEVRHSSNRAARDEAIRLFLSKTWPSQAQAARFIGGKVHRTERVVEKWIREYRRSTSSGTETS